MGAQVSCMRYTIFQQLRIPQRQLMPAVTQVAAANGSLLKVKGTILLETECFCYKADCPGTKPIFYHVIKGLSEEVLLANQHFQILGLVTIRGENDKTPKEPPHSQQPDRPGSFRSLINNLSVSWPESEDSVKPRHVCSKEIEMDELEGVASEKESKPVKLQDIPESVKKIVSEHPKVFKADLDPSDHIDLAKIPGYNKYEEGIKIEVQPGTKPVANHTMRQVPLHYAGQINGMYQELVDQEVVRKVLPNEVCEWVSPSRVVIKTSSTVEDPQLRIVSVLRSLNKVVNRKPYPFPNIERTWSQIPKSTQIMAKIDLKAAYHQLKVHIDSQKYLNFSSPIGLLRYLKIPMGLRSSGDFLCGITQTIFNEAKEVSLIQSIDDYLICATDTADLERQLKEVVRVAEKYGVVFNIDKIEVGSQMVYVGMLIRCQKNGPPVISPDPNYL